MTDDVPLICDPVPGPAGMFTTAKALTPQQVYRLRAQWLFVTSCPWRGLTPIEWPDDIEWKPAVGDRTDWPDAEFCGA